MKSATWQHVHGGDVRATNHGPPLTMNALLVVAVVVATVFIGALALLPPGPDVGVDRGLWLSPDRIGQLPMSGQAWDEVAAAAAAFDPSMTDYGWQDSTDGTSALAAALVFARTGDPAMRAKVVEAINTIASGPYVTDRNPSALGWARSMTSWVVASDLVDLRAFRPDIDAQWSTFLSGMIQHPYSGDGGANLLDLAVNRANNIGAVARSAVTAIAIYTNDDVLTASMAEIYRAWLEGSPAYRFDWDKAKDRSWQCQPGNPATYTGINPANCTRDGNDLSGVLPEEYRRSGTYDPNNFPGSNKTKYPWEALGAAIGQAEMLHRAGYPDALEWGDRAPLRALDRLWQLHTLAPDDGWTFGRASGGGSDDRWIIPLINALYRTNYPEPSATGHGRPMSWTGWTHPN